MSNCDARRPTSLDRAYHIISYHSGATSHSKIPNTYVHTYGSGRDGQTVADKDGRGDGLAKQFRKAQIHILRTYNIHTYIHICMHAEKGREAAEGEKKDSGGDRMG